MTADDIRTFALSLAGASEQDHHGRPSFRVDGRIFATLWTPTEVNVMAGEPAIRWAVETQPFCSEVMWGGRLAAVRVDLPAADPAVVEELLLEARDHKRKRRAEGRRG
jgi:hypothetical protein